MTNTFVNAVANQETLTTNGMKARVSTANAAVDLFFKIGASRGKDISKEFIAAYVENPDLAMRIALWARDPRGGAGERQIFRDILNLVADRDRDRAIALVNRVPQLGRWDDLLEIKDIATRDKAYALIKEALDQGNGLAAKWMPRKGPVAVALRNFFGWTPKFYRKRLVELTKVVETQMCAKDWDNINFNHVPSLAAARYKRAFNRHTPNYAAYVEALKSGAPDVKVNVGAVYPYDVLKGLNYYDAWARNSVTETDHAVAQWNALPNFIGNAKVLPLVDVSGSMGIPVGKSLTAMEVALSLGLYFADKNVGKFKDTFLTFSRTPELITLKGSIIDKLGQMSTSKWGMNTDISKAFAKILEVAINGNVPKEEMPETLVIFSDMQFDACVRSNGTALDSVTQQFKNAGYDVPKVVFWNLVAYDNVPVKFNEEGVALVSGFSPALAKSILAMDLDNFTPENIMLNTIMNDRYNF